MITVHTLGVNYRWVPPETLQTQLRLAHDLREDLVTLQLAYDDDLKAIWSTYPTVAVTEMALAAAEQAAEAAATAVNEERIRLRGKKIASALTSALAQARTRVRAARQARRDAIAAVKDDAAARRKDRTDQLRAAQKALYAQYCQQGDLYWATFNDVLDHHKNAVQRIVRQRASGKPAALRHHRFDGSGSIAIQLRRLAGMPARTPEVLADTKTGRYRNVLTMPWCNPDIWAHMTRSEQRHAGRVTVRMRCGSTAGQPQWIDLPVQAHRWLPADADIIGARLIATRTGATYSVRLAITARVGDPEPSAGATVALHIGWRKTDNGTVVATWRSDTPLTIPTPLTGVVVPDSGGRTGHVIMPAVVNTRLDRHAETASVRGLSLDAIRATVIDHLTATGPLPYRDTELTAADIALWRSPARFAALATAWRDHPNAAIRDIGATLETWRHADKKLWQRQEHGRAKAIGHRDDLYRQVAAMFSTQCKRIILDGTSIAELARTSKEQSELPNQVQQDIDRRRDHAAPGTLREFIHAAGTRDGLEITTVRATDLSRTHARCGHINPADDRYLTRPVTCDGCGASYDPDASATIIMMGIPTPAADGP